MKSFLLGVACLAALLPSAAVAANAQIEATVRQFIDAFDKGDAKAAAATHIASGASIIDEVPPYGWQGPKAFGTWAADLAKHDKALGISEEAVTLGKMSRELVSGSTAYVIFEATYSFKQKGVAMHEPAQMTFALMKVGAAWKIAGWTWTGPDPTPVKPAVGK
jgi:opacity protein-like surface antigen